MIKQSSIFITNYSKTGYIVAFLMIFTLLFTGCGGSEVKPQAQGQAAGKQQSGGAGQNDEQSFKTSCQELELRGLADNFVKYMNKPVKAVGPVTEVVKLSNGNVRVKVKYPDTDAVWITSEKAMLREPKVGKRVEFWGVLLGKGEKSKLPEVSAKYINIL